MLLGSAYGKVGLDTSGVATGVQNAIGAVKNLKSSFELLNGGLNALKSNFETAKGAVAAARAEFERLKASGAGKEAITAAADSLKKLEANAAAAGKALGSAQGQIQQLAAAGKQAGSVLQGVGNALTIGVTLPLVAAGGAAIKLASDLNETKAKTGEIFKSMTGEVIAWSNSANKALGMTRQQALDAADTFALFGKAAGKSGQDLVGFAKENVQFATDFASFYNANPEEAITAIGAAYRGESEPIRRFNILLNDQIIKEKALAMGIYDGNGALSMQARILAVNAIIAEQGSAAIGDFARTSGGLANQTRILSAQFKDSLVVMGERLLPIAVKLVMTLNTMLDIFQKMPGWMQSGILVLLMFAAALGPILGGLGSLLTTVSSLATAWPALTAAFATMGVTLPSLGALFTSLAGTISGVGPALMGLLGPLAVLLPAVGVLVLAWTTDFLGFRTNLENMSQQIPVIISYYWTQAIRWLQSVDWGGIGRSIVTGLINGVGSMAGQLYETLRNLAEQALASAKSALGISSPSKKFAYLGQMSAAGYLQGMRQMDVAQIARTVAAPVNNVSTRQANMTVNQNFGSGLSVRESRKLQAEQEKRLYKGLAKAFA